MLRDVRTISTWTTVTVLMGLVGTLGGCGCSMPWDDKNYPTCCDGVIAEVKIEDQIITVRGSQHDYCDAGVRHLRNQDWKSALSNLKQAVETKSEDDCAHFALGVTYEKTGDLERAFKHYKRANFLRDFPLYSEAFHRLKDKTSQ